MSWEAISIVYMCITETNGSYLALNPAVRIRGVPSSFDTLKPSLTANLPSMQRFAAGARTYELNYLSHTSHSGREEK